MPPTRYRSIGPTLVIVVRMTLNQRPAMLSLILSSIMRRFAFS